MKRHKLGAFIDAVYAIIITICILDLEKPASLTWGSLWEIRASLFAYTVTFFMMVSMWVQIHFLWDQIKFIDHAVVWACLVFLFTSSFIPYMTSLMMTENFSNEYFSILYGGLTIFISLNLLIIQKAAERCNRHIFGKGMKSKLMPSQQIMFNDILIKIAGTLISVFLWPPFILIAVFIAFEYNSISSIYIRKKMLKDSEAHKKELEAQQMEIEAQKQEIEAQKQVIEEQKQELEAQHQERETLEEEPAGA